MLLEYLKAGDTLLGIIGAAFMAIMGFLAWLDRRGRLYADAVRTASDAQHDRTQARLAAVETRLGSIEVDVNGMSVRVQVLEARLSSLATAREVGELARTVAGLVANAEQVSGKVDTLYRAALARSESR